MTTPPPPVGASPFSELVGRLDGLGGPIPDVSAAQLAWPARKHPSAILALLTEDVTPELLFTERAETLRRHPGEVSFPGGRIDPGDTGPEDAALREASEEVGVDPRGVTLLGRLPATRVISSFNATIVVGTWDGLQPLVPEPGEVAQVLRYPVDLLASHEVRHMSRLVNGHSGPAFVIDDIVIWGFTAHLVDWLLDLGGWRLDWDESQVVEVPRRFWRHRPA
ncbi:NUDIX hydrolase [Propionibacteriaceae bacterium G57]|uniref:NUDIX hydrolase n=1 Tax=Aestuariimicrobium sp. G57 TaxID=3418485 RepID=UPI003DA79318